MGKVCRYGNLIIFKLFKLLSPAGTSSMACSISHSPWLSVVKIVLRELFAKLDLRGTKPSLKNKDLLFPLRFANLIVKPWPQTPSPKPFSPKPKTKGPWADTKLLQATATHPPPPPPAPPPPP